MYSLQCGALLPSDPWHFKVELFNRCSLLLVFAALPGLSSPPRTRLLSPTDGTEDMLYLDVVCRLDTATAYPGTALQWQVQGSKPGDTASAWGKLDIIAKRLGYDTGRGGAQSFATYRERVV